MLAGGNANVWFCSVRNRTGIVRGTRVIVRNGRNDAFEPGGLIKSASKPHGSIFSDRLDNINCHFLLDTCHPANFNCPRIRGSHANAHDRQTWIQSRFQISIDRGGKFNSRCKVLHRSKRKLRKTPVRSSARVGRHDHGFSRMSLLVRYILFPSIRFDFPNYDLRVVYRPSGLTGIVGFAWSASLASVVTSLLSNRICRSTRFSTEPDFTAL